MAQPFKLNYRNEEGKIDLQVINGYQQALNEVFFHIASATQKDPNKRYIDAVEILDRITATSEVLAPLFKQAIEELIDVMKQ